jgi:hypothetical protein
MNKAPTKTWDLRVRRQGLAPEPADCGLGRSGAGTAAGRGGGGERPGVAQCTPEEWWCTPAGREGNTARGEGRRAWRDRGRIAVMSGTTGYGPVTARSSPVVVVADAVYC